MLSSRDRMIAGMFAVQLAAAAVLGALLVHGLHDANKGTGTLVSTDSNPSGLPRGGPSTGPTVGSTGLPSAGTSGGAVPSSGAGGPSAVPTAGPTSGQQPGAGAVVAVGAPIKIGAIVTQTGSINFQSSALGLKAYIDMVNAQGGVNGHKLQLELADDQLDAARGRSEAQAMIDDHIFSFVGWNAPDTESTIQPLIDKYAVPLVGSYGEYVEYHDKWMYAFTADYIHYTYEMARMLTSHAHLKKVALVYIDNSDNNANNQVVQGWRQALAEAHVAAGSVFKESPVQGSYDGVVTQMSLEKDDGVVSILDPTAYQRFLDSENQALYHPTHVADPLFDTPAVLAKANTEGTFVATDVDFLENHAPGPDAYVAAVRSEFGPNTATDWLGEVGWLDGQMFVTALGKLGNHITRAGLLQALAGMSGQVNGFTKPLTITGSAHDMNRCLELGKITNGKVAMVQGWTCDSLKA